MKLRANLGKVFSAVRQRGLSHTVDLACARHMANEGRRLQRNLGLDTEKVMMLEDLTIESKRRKGGFYYAPSYPRVVDSLLSNLPVDMSNYTFVDIGSGKGLVLLMAASYPFKEVLGVEFASELHMIAENNIAKLDKSCQIRDRVRSVNQDAADFEIPASDCVLYFCNPFIDSVMQEVVDHVGQSFQCHGQKIFILFHQLREEEEISMANPLPIFEAADFLRERKFRPRSLWERFLLKGMTMIIYETID